MLTHDIIPYIDGNGLVCNRLVEPGQIQGSDNGVLFTAEFIHLASLNKEVISDSYIESIKKCVIDGTLRRAPLDLEAEAPDDMYGAASLDIDFKLPLRCAQPVLVYMKLLKVTSLTRVLSPIAASIIALSNIFEDKTSTGDKMLTWVIIRGLESKSILCKIAGKIWTYRMKRIYGGSTAAIPGIYFGPNHPFVKYWKE